MYEKLYNFLSKNKYITYHLSLLLLRETFLKEMDGAIKKV